MKFIRWSVVLASVALAGCFLSKPVEVRITPDAYQVGEVKSELATPAVDEVVRIKPGKVLILACRATKPRKIMQFQDELQARHQAKLNLAFVDEGCPTP